jgi:hypothetical protein
MDRLLKYAGQQSVIRPRDLVRLHIPRNYLGRLVRAGKLERVGNGESDAGGGLPQSATGCRLPFVRAALP